MAKTPVVDFNVTGKGKSGVAVVLALRDPSDGIAKMVDGTDNPIPVTGTVATTQAGKSAVDKATNDYSSVNVTTGAYVQIKASLAAACTEVEIFDSSGESLLLATGGSGSESDKIYIFPGGNGRVPLSIASGTRVSVKALSATASTGVLLVNFYG